MPADRPSRIPDIALVGLGNWGTSLAHALIEAHLPLREIVVRNPRRASPLPAVPWHRARLGAKILWLCVPDREVAAAATQLAAHADLHGRIVLHSSGALTVDALVATRHAGAQTAAVHPVMTFPSRTPVPLTGVLFGIESPSPAPRRALAPLIRRLGGQPFTIRSQDKALYHAAGTLASPLLVSALTTAIETAQAAGLSRRHATAVVHALAQATLHNVLTRGPRNSFSGPFARGDAPTVKLHLQALARHPILTDTYRSLARHALASLPVRNPRALAQALTGGGAENQNQRASGTARQKQQRMRNLRAGS